MAPVVTEVDLTSTADGDLVVTWQSSDDCDNDSGRCVRPCGATTRAPRAGTSVYDWGRGMFPSTKTVRRLIFHAPPSSTNRST
jgi:hypothetical protein